MKALVIGSNGKIGSQLCRLLVDAGYEVNGVGRNELDLAALPQDIAAVTGSADVIYICAAMTRFIDCEDNGQAYSVNVDAPIEIARQLGYARIIYLSSEAVERGLHTNYGMHKALAEMGLRTVCNPTIARLSKVDPSTMHRACEFLIGLANAKPGLYKWHA